MRYFWALLAYSTAVVVSVTSCGGNGGTGSDFGSTQSGGTGGLTGSGAGGNGGSGNGDVGGSSGVGIHFMDSGTNLDSGGTCSAYKGTCAQQKLDCGSAGDGCGNALDCGATCPAGQSCGGSGTANVCGAPSCTGMTCAQQGFNCGMATDGCNTAISCGATCPAGQTCGGGGSNICGAGTACVPKTCAAQSFACGMQSDGCSSLLDCGTCPSGETCGGGGQNGVCAAGVTCTPKSCAQQSFNCGMATDGCGTVIDCGTCASGTCGAANPNQCGSAVSCTGLCTQQTVCAGTATTSITGTVYAPNGTDPLYNTLVYVPNSPVLPFVDGVVVPHCSCGSDVTGSPLVSTTTAVDGTFTLTNMPVGANIPLVIQNGRWRRQIVIPAVPSCVSTPVAATLTHMPTSKAQGDIPLMAFATGSVDSLECVMRKIGVLDSEFTDPSGNGRVRFYIGSGQGGTAGGAQISATTPSETTLIGTAAALEAYDMVLFPCQGGQFKQSAAALANVISYANNGGRVFATHYSYVWLYNNSPFSTTATWAVDPNDLNTFASDPATGIINQGFPKGLALAQWLKVLYPASTLGQIAINTLRHDFTAVAATSSLWISDNDADLGNVPMHYTFDTPVGAAAASQCGRVLYDDFHVEDAENNPTTGMTFPSECDNAAMTPQEKMLEFMLFDLGSCVAPPVCTPKTCAEQNTTCGAVGDGCGAILQCGMCPSGEACVAGMCSNGGCVPKTCAQQSFACGSQGDGCGNAIACGSCPSGESCNAGVCGNGGCTPKSCAAQSISCGSIGDGCGNIEDCGVCPSGQVCGGGVNPMPGKCGTPACTSKTCAQQGFNCGSASDGCGNVITCGTCASGTCGGGGMANVCGGGAG